MHYALHCILFFLFLFTVLQEGLPTLSGSLPGLTAEGDQETVAEGI